MDWSRLDKLNERLDEEQSAVARHFEREGGRNFRVDAVAGAGKTTSLIALIGNALREERVAPNRAVLCTFTNKGAAEIQTRASKIIPKDYFGQVRIGTFHALALEAFQRVSPGSLDFKKCTDTDGRSRARSTPATHALWKNAIWRGPMPGTGAPGLGIKKSDPDDYLTALKLLRAQGVNTPEAFWALKSRPKVPSLFVEAWTLVRAAKAKLEVWDFDDLLFGYAEGLRQGVFPANGDLVIVDEAQDQNRMQIRLARALSRQGSDSPGTLGVIGDILQCIYAFNGAAPELMWDPGVLGENAITYRIQKNYRSVPEIIRISNSVRIAAAGKDAAQAIPSRSVSGGLTRAIQVRPAFLSDEDEAVRIVEEVVEKLRTKNHKPHDFAILTRTNAHLGLFQAEFAQRDIPVAISGKDAFFGTKEAADFLAYARLSIGDSLESFEVIANRPVRYLSYESIADIKKQSVQSRNLVSALACSARQGANELGRLVASIRRKEWSAAIKEVGSILIAAASEAENSGTAKAYDEDRPGMYAALLRTALKYRSAEDFIAFMDRGYQLSRVVDEGNAEGRVLLSTLHAMKGKEAPIVYISASEGDLPYWKALRAGDISEELRLFYVGVSRPKDQLIFTWTVQPRGPGNGDGRPAGPSRFLLKHVQGFKTEMDSLDRDVRTHESSGT